MKGNDEIMMKTKTLRTEKKDNKSSKRFWWIFGSIMVVFTACMVALLIWAVKDVIEISTNVARYEKFLGAEGKYKKNYGTYNDIFPDEIPKSAKVEDFCYCYFNPWDACYLGYLVYTCEQQEFEQEYKRLTELQSSENLYVYGATEFPYELCAVYADDYLGYIYAMADRSENRLIYVELQFANGFTDIAYKKYIDEKYLPIGFDAEYKW